jgi:hypothetical protein
MKAGFQASRLMARSGIEKNQTDLLVGQITPPTKPSAPAIFGKPVFDRPERSWQ